MNPVEAACPRCHARLDVELLRDTGAHTCPFCDADVSAELETEATFEAVTESGRSDAWRSDAPAVGSRLVRPLPPESRLQVVQAEGGRLVLFLPPGGRGGSSLWGFAIFFTAVLALITGGFLMALMAGPAQPQGNPVVMVAMLGVFWMVVLGVWWGVLKMRYQRTLLSVDPERIVLQTTLFGKTRQQELPVLDTTECSLEEAYSVNEVPVYRVRVANEHQSLRFATNLDQHDKDWLVDQIEMMLGNSPMAGSTAEAPLDSDPPLDSDHRPLAVRLSSGALLSREGHALGVAPLSPGELPVKSVIRILEDRPDRLSFSCPLMPSPVARVIIPGVVLVFLGSWMAGVVAMTWRNWQQGGVFLIGSLFSLFMLATALIPIVASLLLAFGRTTVRLTRDLLECDWGWGPFRFQRSMAVDSIEAIVLGGQTAEANPQIGPSVQRPRVGQTERAGCAVTGAGRWLLIAPFADRDLSRQVAGLLWGKLQSWGQRVETRLGGVVSDHSPG